MMSRACRGTSKRNWRIKFPGWENFMFFEKILETSFIVHSIRNPQVNVFQSPNLILKFLT